MTVPGTSGSTSVMEQTSTSTETPWQVVLWNDDANIDKLVTRALIKVLKVTLEVAERHMLTAHLEGKAAIFGGKLDECQQKAAALQAEALYVTLQKAGA